MATNNSSSLPEGSAIRLPGITIEGGNDRYAGLEDLYGFGALYDNDFIDTFMLQKFIAQGHNFMMIRQDFNTLYR